MEEKYVVFHVDITNCTDYHYVHASDRAKIYAPNTTILLISQLDIDKKCTVLLMSHLGGGVCWVILPTVSITFFFYFPL